MRRFSDKEQKYISRLCEATRNTRDSYMPINLLYDYLYNKGVGYTTGSDVLVFDRKVDDVDISEMIAIENTVIELALLLDYLEKNGLIKYVEDRPGEKGNVIGKVIEGGIPKKTAPIVTEQLTKASSYRIVVGETLRDLVINNFKTSEDKTLEAALQQGELAQRSLNEARLQSQNAINALSEAKEQTRLAGESLNESRKQTQNAADALKESRDQTQLAQKSLAEAKEQTKNALEATEEARKQSKRANTNILISSFALFFSILTFCLDQCSKVHVKTDDCLPAAKACEMQQPTCDKDSAAMTIKTKETPVIQSSDKTMQGKPQNKKQNK